MVKKIILALFAFFFIEKMKAQKKKYSSEFYESFNYSVIVKKTNKTIAVFCNPETHMKYSCSLNFGTNFSKKGFTKGYFLRLSKNKKAIFDTIKSSEKNYIYLNFKEDNLILKSKIPQTGCELILPNSFSLKEDTLKLNKIKFDVFAIGIPKSTITGIDTKTKEEFFISNPFIILKKDGENIDILYRDIDKNNNPILRNSSVSIKNCEILK